MIQNHSAFKPSIVIDIDPCALEQMALLRLLLPCCLFFASATGDSDAKIVLLGWTGDGKTELCERHDPRPKTKVLECHFL